MTAIEARSIVNARLKLERGQKEIERLLFKEVKRLRQDLNLGPTA